MLYVTGLNGNTEPLNHIQRPEINEEVNGAFTLALTSFFHANNPGHELLEEESIITVEGYDFRVKQLRENKGRKELVCISTFFDLVGKRQESIYGGTRTFNEFMTFTLGGTGWTFETVDVAGSQMIANFGEDNVIKLINQLCKVYECEYKILPGNHIRFAKQVGSDKDFQFRYKHNIKTISKSVDATNLRTVITGTGANGLKVTYTSPNASKYGQIKADPVVNEELLTESEIVDELKRELQDYPDVAYELDNAELLDREIGELVWLIHEPMGIEFQTRIMSKSSTIRNGKLVTQSVVIGNKVPRTMQDVTTDIKVDVDENEKKTRSRFEQTNDRITLAVEEYTEGFISAYAKIELTAQEIRLEVGELGVQLEEGIANNTSLISQTATQIRLEVSQEITRVDGLIETANSSITQTANQIQSIVTQTIPALDGRVATAESSITQQAEQISSKVSQTDYNGNTIASLINQTSTTVDIQASKINLVGAVTVLSDLSGNLGTITSGNINIEESINVGAGVYMRGANKTGVYFDSWSQIFDSGGTLQIEALNDLTLVARNLNLSDVPNIIWGSNRPTAVWG